MGTLTHNAWYECRQCGILWNEIDIPDDLDDAPDIETLMQWEMDGVCEALDGCLVEPDGTCPHGFPSWLVYLGYC